MTLDQITYRVDGMSCDHCVVAVSDEVGRVAGVSAVDVDLETKLVRIDGTGVDDAAVVAAIDEAGYDAVRGMSTLVKLAGFAVILVAVFGAAVAAGDVLGPDREGAAEQRAATSTHGSSETHGEDAEGEHGAADPIRGLSVREDGLELALERTQLPRGRATELRFSVRDADGAIKDFEVTHEKRMHVIVVRRDGRGFQHLHPEMDARGNWTTRVTLPEAGAYRVFADFKRDDEAYTLAADLSVDGAADYRAFPRPSTVDRTDGYEVKVDTHGSELSFDITRDGKPVQTEPYLGAGGHLVALREGDLAFLHVHPNGDGVAFEADLERGSRYHLYLQFQHGGRVHTAEFTR